MFEIVIYDEELGKSFKEWVEEEVKWETVLPGKWISTNDGHDMYWTKDAIKPNWRMAYIDLSDRNKEAAEIKPYITISEDPETFLAISKSFRYIP
jgi:hypothetical protein